MTTSIEGDLGVLEQLDALVDERLEAEEPDEWGEEVDLAEQERFYGCYLGEAISPVTDRPVLLVRARTKDDGWNGPRCFIRIRTMLQSELDRVRPAKGDSIVIARGDDAQGKENPYYTYVVAAAPCPEPLPEQATGGTTSDDGIPFAPTAA